MTSTIFVLLSGLGILLVGVGLLGTLLGVRATIEQFPSAHTGLIMGGYYAGYILGTFLGPWVIRRVGHIRTFAAFAALSAASVLSFGLWVDPWAWLPLRIINGTSVVILYMVVESWLNAQTPAPLRGRVFAVYMVSTLVALAAGQYLLLVYDPGSYKLFAVATILVTLGLIPIAVTRVTEPRIDVSVGMPLRQLIARSPLGTIGVFTAGLVNGVFWGMTPVFAQRLEMPSHAIALLMSATIFGGALLQYPIGHLSDRHDRRLVIILVSIGAALVSAAVVYVVHSGHPGLMLLAFVYGGLMFPLYGLSVAHTNDHLESNQTLEATRGLLLVYGIGALLGPIGGGLAMDYSGPIGLPLLAALTFSLLAVFGLSRTLVSRSPPMDETTDFVTLVRTTPVVLEMHPQVDTEPELKLEGGGRP